MPRMLARACELCSRCAWGAGAHACAQYGIVVNEVKDTATAPLRAIRLLAEFFQAAGNQEKQEAVLGKLKELQNTSQEPTVHVMTATALIHVENHGDALRVLRSGGDNLEWCVIWGTRAARRTQTNLTLRLGGRINAGNTSLALTIQVLLKMNRLDLARPELARMRSIEDDATLTALSEAWVDCVLVRSPGPAAVAVAFRAG